MVVVPGSEVEDPGSDVVEAVVDSVVDGGVDFSVEEVLGSWVVDSVDSSVVVEIEGSIVVEVEGSIDVEVDAAVVVEVDGSVVGCAGLVEVSPSDVGVVDSVGLAVVVIEQFASSASTHFPNSTLNSSPSSQSKASAMGRLHWMYLVQSFG